MAIQPKYRLLTSDELHEMEKEFVDFLVVNGITADKWVELKSDDKEAAEDMITLFSDVVFERVLRQVDFLEFRSKNDLKTFQCLENKIVLVGMTADAPDVDFQDEDFLKSALTNPPKGIKVYTSEKSYQSSRQEELFQMISSGCEIADGKLFKALALSLS